MFHTEVILPTERTYLADQNLPYSDDHCITMETLVNLDQSKFSKATTLPLTLPEMIIGEYLVTNTHRFKSMDLCNGEPVVSKHRIVIDGRPMPNMYLTVRASYLMSSGQNRVYIGIVTELDEITVHVISVDF